MNVLRVLITLAVSIASCALMVPQLHAEPAPQLHAELAPANVTIEHVFPVSADAAWKELGRFSSIADWQSLVAKCIVNERKDGIYRTVVMRDKSVFVERLEEYSSSERRFAYSIQSGPLQIDNYRSELRFVPVGTNQTRLVWRAWYVVRADGDATRIASNLNALFANGIKGMAVVLAAAH